MKNEPPKTAKELIEVHQELRQTFTAAQKRHFEAFAAYRKAKSELNAFTGRFGRILSLFED